MPCGCRKTKPLADRRSSETKAVTAAGAPRYTVEINGFDSGRVFTSLAAAREYAGSVNGEVRAN